MRDFLKNSVFFPDRRFQRAYRAGTFVACSAAFLFWILRSAPSSGALAAGAITTGILILLLWVEGLLLGVSHRKQAEIALKELEEAITSGRLTEHVIVQRASAASRLFPRIRRRAVGKRNWTVEYYGRLDESFEAYLFVIPGNRLGFFRQSRFVVAKEDLDRHLSRAA